MLIKIFGKIIIKPKAISHVAGIVATSGNMGAMCFAIQVNYFYFFLLLFIKYICVCVDCFLCVCVNENE